ncbi:MAG: type II secretion system protein [bacterium]
MYRDCWGYGKSEKNSFSTRIRNNKGFSLIAALITVGIIIMLTGIALVYLRNASNRAKVNKAKVEIEIMGRAIEQIGEDTGNYLKSLEQLDDETPPDGSFSPWWGPYVSSLPVDIEDPWNTSYVYFFWVTGKKGKEFQLGNYPPGPKGKGWKKGKKKGWGDKSLPPGLWKKLGDKENLSEKGFLVFSAGPDGEVDTEDDIEYGTY